MGGNLFWGLLLVILGLTLIIKVVFHVDIPVFKVFLAFLLIYLGIKILAGNFHHNFSGNNPNDIILGERNFTFSHDSPLQQNIVFGRGVIDFRTLSVNDLPRTYNVSTVFGACEMLIPKNLPVKMQIDVAFADAELPGGNTTAFGSSVYQSPAFHTNQPYLFIKADVVFGGLKIIEY